MQNPTNPGASNASDFQPPTGNPQIPGQLQTDQETVQNDAMNELLQNSNARISVPNNPAPPRPAVAEAKSNAGMFFVIAIVIAILLLVLYLWRRRGSKVQQTVVEAPIVNEVIPTSEQPLPAKQRSVDPKKRAARKAAKKRKRIRK